jgi:hypothetical protein
MFPVQFQYVHVGIRLWSRSKWIFEHGDVGSDAPGVAVGPCPSYLPTNPLPDIRFAAMSAMGNLLTPLRQKEFHLSAFLPFNLLSPTILQQSPSFKKSAVSVALRFEPPSISDEPIPTIQLNAVFEFPLSRAVSIVLS